MHKNFHNLILGVSVLPALLVMPAMAEYTDVINIQNNTDLDITEDVNISNKTGHGILVSTAYNDSLFQGSVLTINADSVNVSADRAAILTQHRTENGPNDDPTKILITADNINLIGQNGGGGGNSRSSDGYGVISAMSQGVVELNGNTTIKANPNLNNDAILARGNAVVKINENTTDKTTKINGNIDFNYNDKDSGSTVNANVDVTFNGSKSYWTGNTVMSYDTKKNATKMHQNETVIRLKNGAIWNATVISDIETDTDGGYFYTALNNLDIDKGTVNIADAKRGIIVENAIVKDAIFNGGPLNFGTMMLTGGENSFNTNVSGIDADSKLIVDADTIMNIGTNIIAVDTMSLNGTLNATLLNTNKFASLAVNNFDAESGSMVFTLKGVGDYKVFQEDVFDNSKIEFDYDKSLFDDPVWNADNNTLTVSMRPVEDIAKNTGIAGDSAVAVSHVAEAASNSDSVQLQSLSLKLQEQLAKGNTDAVEHATKAIHPETESVAQSVSSSVQNTVVNLAASRMSAPSAGRNGGDAKLTSGGVWAQGLFNKSKQANAFNGYTRGIALGLDGTINKHWTIGAGYSYAHSDINGTARTTEIDSDTVFVYGQYKPSQWYLNAIANYTMSDYSEKGTVIDNTPIFGDYSVDSFGGALATGYDFKNGITPELGLRYMHVNANDYANSYGIKTHMDASDFLTGVVGARYAFNIVATKHTTFMPQLNAGVKYDLLSDKQVATVAMPGVNAYTLDGNRLNRVGGEFGIGLGIKHGNLEISANYDIDVRKEYTSQTGMLKLRANF